MSEAATKEPQVARLVTKSELCEAISWSRMRLDRRLEEDAAFPVEHRGAQGEPWSFDLAAVQAYLEPEEERELQAEDLGSADARSARAELTARQRRDLAQAQLHEDKLRRNRGELIEADGLRMALTETVSRVNTVLNKMPETLTRRLNLPPTAEPVLRQEIDEVRRQLVIGLRELLAE